MHKYLHHIGDFMRDTVHLTALEECFYRRALDFYYLNEGPLPKETQSVFRRLRALTDEEKQAVLNVLNDFFNEEDDGFHNKRCDSEIAGYKENVQKNRENGKKGGRPPKKKEDSNPNESDFVDSENPEKTQSVILGCENETQKNLNHKPLTNNQFIDSSSNTREQDFPLPPIQFSQYQPEDHKRYSVLECVNVYPIHYDFIELGKQRNPELPEQDLISMFTNFGDFFSAKADSKNTPSLWLVKWFTWIQNNKDEVRRQREAKSQPQKPKSFSGAASRTQNEVSDWMSEIGSNDQPAMRDVHEVEGVKYA
ncbi:YdaU family protein [Acinetobacter radioresistens]|uniref:YdaU family protein n=1 Tax=Acinetobacter radioresistens TaxID=40216 RepID=UPI0020054829|nr:YdaU family protein [Acinetobacter radioresistens]MCK4077529.1 YdaU family protein [Acinetobacter radioresistens]